MLVTDDDAVGYTPDDAPGDAAAAASDEEVTLTGIRDEAAADILNKSSGRAEPRCRAGTPGAGDTGVVWRDMASIASSLSASLLALLLAICCATSLSLYGGGG